MIHESLQPFSSFNVSRVEDLTPSCGTTFSSHCRLDGQPISSPMVLMMSSARFALHSSVLRDMAISRMWTTIVKCITSAIPSETLRVGSDISPDQGPTTTVEGVLFQVCRVASPVNHGGRWNDAVGPSISHFDGISCKNGLAGGVLKKKVKFVRHPLFR